MDDEAKGQRDDRSHHRQPIELRVEYKRLNSFFSDYTHNISKGGTFIRTTKPLDVGTEFLFKLHVARMEEPLCITGQVQWVVTPEDIEAGMRTGTGEPGMGIRFIYREAEEAQEIERRVEKVMIDSLGQRLYSKLMEQSRTEGDGPQDRYASPFTGLAESYAAARKAASEEMTAVRRKPDQ
jgi:type IV pilus assembly protein PilZ